MTSVLWLRRDLRLRDHPALVAAFESAGAGGVLPVFVVDPQLLGTSRRAGALVELIRSLAHAPAGPTAPLVPPGAAPVTLPAAPPPAGAEP